jgi:hypothetical protein
VPIVASAGNEYEGDVLYPAAYSSSYSNLIAVSSTDATDTFSPFSSQGSQVCVSAPGGYGYPYDADDIYSTTPNYSFNLGEWYGISQNYGYMAGTSMSAPHVSGIAGLLLSINPNLTPSQIRTIIQQSAEDKGTAGFDNYYGYGRVNAYKALKYTLENYGGTLTQSFTIPSGETWNFAAGVTVKFASGVSLTSNGVLNVSGTSGSRVTFTSVSGTAPGSWGSIVLSGSGANNSTISYANIQYGTEVRLNNVANSQIQYCNITNTINGIYSYNSVCTINDNTLLNQRDHGIIAYNSSVTNNRNTITKSDNSGAGMLYTAGGYSMTGYQNDIYGYNWGIGSSWGAYARFPNNGQKNNRVSNCLYGLYVYQSGTVYIPTSTYGKNSIKNNTNYNAYVYASGNVYASYNYWGWPVPTNKFYYEAGSYLDYSNALDKDPWKEEEEMVTGGEPFASILSMNLPNTANAVYTTASGTEDIVAQARELRESGNSQEAFELLQPLFNNNDYSVQAIIELYALYQDQQLKTTIEGMLSNISTEKTPLGRYYYGLILSRKGSSQLALQVFEGLSSTSFGRAAALAKFYIHLFDEKRTDRAEAILNTITASTHDEELELSLARHSLNSSMGKFDGENLPNAPGEERVSTTVSEFGLKSNYPNPFNPVTTIAFNLQISGYTTLKIFDVLGREVATLVNEYLEVGMQHQRMFDASQLPSGIYYYALKSGGKQEVKKMLYLK